MKKLALFLLIPVLVFACGIVLTACGSATAAERDMELAGEIPFDLNDDFSFKVSMESTAAASSQSSAEFYAMSKDGEMYACYTYMTYDRDNDNALLTTRIEERRFVGGTNERKFTYIDDEIFPAVDFYEDWTPDHLTSTAAVYIQNFLNGNYTADTPYNNNLPQYGYAMPSDSDARLSKVISRKDANVSLTTIYKDGTDTITFDGGAKTVDKYRGTAMVGGKETKVMEVMVWGNIVVKADPFGTAVNMKYTVNAEYNDEVTQSEWDESGAAGDAL